MSFNPQDIISIIKEPLTFMAAVVFFFLFFLSREEIIKSLEGRFSLDRDQYFKIMIYFPTLIFLILSIAMVFSMPPKEKFELTLLIGYVFFLNIPMICFAAYLTKTKNKTTQSLSGHTSMSNYTTINKWLIRLTDSEFSMMLHSLRDGNVSLMQLPDHPSKTEFLGAMQRWGKLQEVENYLLAAYPDRFHV